jgi:quercetin dioxygenase-like cupin family protein
VPEHVSSSVLHLPGGVRARVHVTGDDSGGALVVMTDEAPPGWALPPHRHANESETIHVTAGSFWIEMDGRHEELTAGGTVHVPRGTLHSGGTLGDEPVHRVVIFAPAGMEHFFRALAGTRDRAAMLRLAGEHGWTFS